MFLFKTNWLMRALYPQFVWRMSPNNPTLYLTFDDGPIPHVTEWVLNTLQSYRAKATFFCIGDNVRKHPQLLQCILNEGHTVGNHTYNHLNGWKTPLTAYTSNVEACKEVLPPTRLFRPPYGRISRSQGKALLTQGYQIVMWDVLTGDFSASIEPEKCLAKTIQYSQNGSIVVLHDSLKAEANLRYVLPRLLEHFSKQGFRFAALTP